MIILSQEKGLLKLEIVPLVAFEINNIDAKMVRSKRMNSVLFLTCMYTNTSNMHTRPFFINSLNGVFKQN